MLNEYILENLHSGDAIVPGDEVHVPFEEIEEITQANLRDAYMDLVIVTDQLIVELKKEATNLNAFSVASLLEEIANNMSDEAAMEQVMKYMGYEIPTDVEIANYKDNNTHDIED